MAYRSRYGRTCILTPAAAAWPMPRAAPTAVVVWYYPHHDRHMRERSGHPPADQRLEVVNALHRRWTKLGLWVLADDTAELFGTRCGVRCDPKEWSEWDAGCGAI